MREAVEPIHLVDFSDRASIFELNFSIDKI